MCKYKPKLLPRLHKQEQETNESLIDILFRISVYGNRLKVLWIIIWTQEMCEYQSETKELDLGHKSHGSGLWTNTLRLSTFDMTPFQLEDAYNSGSMPVINRNEPESGTEETPGVRILSTVGSANPNILANQAPLLPTSSGRRGGAIPMNNLLAFVHIQTHRSALNSNIMYWYKVSLTGEERISSGELRCV